MLPYIIRLAISLAIMLMLIITLVIIVVFERSLEERVKALEDKLDGTGASDSHH